MIRRGHCSSANAILDSYSAKAFLRNRSTNSRTKSISAEWRSTARASTIMPSLCYPKKPSTKPIGRRVFRRSFRSCAGSVRGHLVDRSIPETSSQGSSSSSERGRMGFRPRYEERCPKHCRTVPGCFGMVGTLSACRFQRSEKRGRRSRENPRGFCHAVRILAQKLPAKVPAKTF